MRATSVPPPTTQPRVDMIVGHPVSASPLTAPNGLVLQDIPARTPPPPPASAPPTTTTLVQGWPVCPNSTPPATTGRMMASRPILQAAQGNELTVADTAANGHHPAGQVPAARPPQGDPGTHNGSSAPATPSTAGAQRMAVIPPQHHGDTIWCSQYSTWKVMHTKEYFEAVDRRFGDFIKGNDLITQQMRAAFSAVASDVVNISFHSGTCRTVYNTAVQACQVHFESLWAQRHAESQASLQKLGAAQQLLQQSYATLQSQNAAVANRNEILTGQIDAIKHLGVAVERECNIAVGENTALAKSLSDVQKQKGELDAKYASLVAQHEKCSSKYADLLSKHRKCDSEYSDLKAQHEQCDSKYSDLLGQHQQAEDEKRKNDLKYTKLKAQHEQYDNEKRRIEELEAKLRLAEEAHEEQRHVHAEELRKLNSAHDQKVVELQKDHEEKKGALETLLKESRHPKGTATTEMTALSHDLKEAKDDVKKTQESLNTPRESLADSKKELATALKSNASVVQERDTLKEQQVQAKVEAQILRSTVATLKKFLDDERAEKGHSTKLLDEFIDTDMPNILAALSIQSSEADGPAFEIVQRFTTQVLEGINELCAKGTGLQADLEDEKARVISCGRRLIEQNSTIARQKIQVEQLEETVRRQALLSMKSPGTSASEAAARLMPSCARKTGTSSSPGTATSKSTPAKTTPAPSNGAIANESPRRSAPPSNKRPASSSLQAPAPSRRRTASDDSDSDAFARLSSTNDEPHHGATKDDPHLAAFARSILGNLVDRKRVCYFCNK